MKPKKIILKSGTKIFLGKDAKSNDELVKQFKGKENIIMHTAKPGSGFCVIKDLKPSKRDIKEAAIFCARYSHDWRDNKSDVNVHMFKGKEVYKEKGMKIGTWKVKNSKTKTIKKQDIEKCQKNKDKCN